VSENVTLLGPPEVLWFHVRLEKQSPKAETITLLEYWTGFSPRAFLRELYPAGHPIYERGGRKYILYSEHVAFIKATSKRKEFSAPDDTVPPRFTRDRRGRISAIPSSAVQ
jgi:hypothetical protein